MKIRPVRDELFQGDGLTDGHDEADSRSLQFRESALKNRDVRLYRHSTCTVQISLLVSFSK